MMPASLLNVDKLSVALPMNRVMKPVVSGLSFDVKASEILAIVGESGSGKSMTAKALMGLLPKGAKTSGSAQFQGANMLTRTDQEKQLIRGTGIGMIFQEPMSALNPVLTIGLQMTEALLVHGLADQSEANRKAVEMLDRVGIPSPQSRLGQYPHEFSGGMRQRVMIAMTMLLKPDLIIADEPTTALDVTVQAQILDLLTDLVAETNIGLLLITHDMGVVAETADRVLVMKHGKGVEEAPVRELFANPQASYTKALLAAVPRLDADIAGPPQRAGADAPILDVQDLTKSFSRKDGFWRSRATTRALNNVSLSVRQGETLAIVGESGSGKSTLARAITRLLTVDSGSVMVNGQDFLALKGETLREARSDIQMIFQDPYSSLDPRFRIGRAIEEPIRIHNKIASSQARQQVSALLEQVGLSPDMAERYPHEFSGGQRQRIAISRALACNPKILVADEPTSALDVSIQAQVLDLLLRLKKELDLTMLFISHDLAVVGQISDRVAVMRGGQILELGPTARILHHPQHPYTVALLSAAPSPDPEMSHKLRAKLPMLEDAGPLQEFQPGHWVAT
ncbi:MAG: ABC transporter ATP-binding protein [Hyphomicrobiales bacterium]